MKIKKKPPVKFWFFLIPVVSIALGLFGLAYSGKDFQAESGFLVIGGAAALSVAFIIFPTHPKRHIGGKPRRPWERKPKRYIGGRRSTLRFHRVTFFGIAAFVVWFVLVFKPYHWIGIG